MLTPRRERFVNQYLVDMNGAQAAIRAGYAIGSARQTAHLLLTKADVQAAIRAKQGELAMKASDLSAFVVETFYSMAKNATHDRDRIHAAENLGKLLGLYVTKTETHITHEHVATLSDSQLARMEAIYREPIEGTARVLDEGAA